MSSREGPAMVRWPFPREKKIGLDWLQEEGKRKKKKKKRPNGSTQQELEENNKGNTLRGPWAQKGKMRQAHIVFVRGKHV